MLFDLLLDPVYLFVRVDVILHALDAALLHDRFYLVLLASFNWSWLLSIFFNLDFLLLLNWQDLLYFFYFYLLFFGFSFFWLLHLLHLLWLFNIFFRLTFVEFIVEKLHFLKIAICKNLLDGLVKGFINAGMYDFLVDELLQ